MMWEPSRLAPRSTAAIMDLDLFMMVLLDADRLDVRVPVISAPPSSGAASWRFEAFVLFSRALFIRGVVEAEGISPLLCRLSASTAAVSRGEPWTGSFAAGLAAVVCLGSAAGGGGGMCG